MRRLGYLNCSAMLDEKAESCAASPRAFRWLGWAWERAAAAAAAPAAADDADPTVAQLSWWLRPGDTERADADAFGAARFVRAVLALAGADDGGARPRGGGGVRQVVLVGDSTARQQAASLCCLLVAGAAALGDGLKTRMVANRHSGGVGHSLRCRAMLRGGGGVEVVYDRVNKLGGSLPQWRPHELTPRLDATLLQWIRRAPAVLILSASAWEYEEGCDSMIALHDSVCNGTRWWTFADYAKRWALVGAALDAAYPRAKRRHSLVAVRTASPRDFEPGHVNDHGSCRRTAPLTAADEPRADDARSSRFAVQTQNLLLLATVAQRHPWVRVLDGYEISHLRADAHPAADDFTRAGRASKRDKRRSGDDCLHYCVPGVPDVYNGRLLSMLRDHVAPGRRHSARGEATALVEKWNFVEKARGVPFVARRPADGALTLALQPGRATLLECAPPADAKGSLGYCVD